MMILDCNAKEAIQLLLAALLGFEGLAANAAGTALAEGRSVSELDVLLTVQAHHEPRHVDQSLADANVALTNQHASVVLRLGQTTGEHDGLQTAVEESLSTDLQHVVELLLALVEETQTSQAVHKGLTFEQALWVLLGQS